MCIAVVEHAMQREYYINTLEEADLHRDAQKLSIL